MKYFESCKTLDELKKAYYKAAKANHPDHGGSTEAMQEINAEYSQRFEELKRYQNTRAAEDATGATKATTESAGDFTEIVEYLLNLDGIEVELCGRWLWISGETKAHKEELKAAGCRWASKKKMWSWHFAEDGEKFSRGKKSMNYIRAKYGSVMFQQGEAKTAIA